MDNRVRLATAIGLLFAFGVLAVWAHGPSVLPGDVRFARWVQGRDWPLLDPLVDMANWSMRTVPLAIGVAIILGAILLRGLRGEAVVLVLASLMRALSYPFKELIASPRPTSDLIQVAVDASGFGFPGGRAGNAVLVIGAIAWIAARNIDSRSARVAIWTVSIVWIVVAGIARIRVGAHWPSDILGAWLWTTAALFSLTMLVRTRRMVR